MSRRSQDIPIRPRYGLTDDEDETKGHQQQQEVASSYSEIPFFPEKNVANADMTTPTATVMPMPDGSDSLEEEDSAEDDSSSGANKKQQRPNSLQCDTIPYELEGSNAGAEGEMRHFVAENMEEQLRKDSPLSKRDQFGFVSHNSTPSTSTGGGLLTRHFLQTQVPQIDANVLSDIEIEAQYLAGSVDNLIENLYNLLHSISSITADNVEVHKNAVNKLTDSMDANIKCMYTIMAKTEEITKSMKPTEQLGQRIREIKRLVDMLDNTM